jgi:hypothetical protein
MNLNKNSEEMKTVVETFVMEETAELIYDNEKLTKWKQLVQDLGLSGQELVHQPEKSPIPYMFMNQNLINIAETLCPRKEHYKDYNATPIPLEILEHISLSVNEGYFEKIEIWYDDKTKDPFAIGINNEWKLCDINDKWQDHEDKTLFTSEEKAKTYIRENKLVAQTRSTWNTKYYLIGKWADVKRSFEELRDMAVKRFKTEFKENIDKRIKEAKRELEDIDNKSFERFGA